MMKEPEPIKETKSYSEMTDEEKLQYIEYLKGVQDPRD